MKPALSFQPLTEKAAAQLLLDGGCSLETVYLFICQGDRTIMTEEQAGVILLRHGQRWDAVDEWLRRMRR